MIEAYFTDSVVWLPAPSLDQWGEPVEQIETVVAGRLEWKSRLIRDKSGREVLSGGLLLTKAAIQAGDRVRVDNDARVVLSVTEAKGFDVSHYEVWMQ